MSEGKKSLWHPHVLIPNSADNGWACDGRSQPDRCRRGITGFNQTTGVPRFRCDPCDYDLCDACMTASLPSEDTQNEEKKAAVVETPGEEKVKEEAHFPTLLNEQVGLLVEQTKFSDVLFHVGEKKIPAHRLILAVASPVFEAMFYTRKPGTTEYDPSLEKAPLEVKLNGVEPEIFQALLKCIYTDKAEITATNIQGLIQAANKYNVESLRVACAEFMEGDVTKENILELFQIAPTMLGDEEFGLSFIEANIEEIIQQDGWLKLPKDRLIAILKSDNLAIEEIELFKAVHKWAEAESKRKEGGDVKTSIKDLLPYIRFPTMELAHIAAVVAPSNVLEQPQLVGLFSYVSVPDEKIRALLPNPGFPTIPRTGGGGSLFTWDTKKHGRNVTLSNNNLTATTKAGGWSSNLVLGSREFKSGNHYWEVKLDMSTGDMIGVASPSVSVDLTSTYIAAAQQVYFINHSSGVYGGTGLSPTSVSAYAKTGDTLGFGLTFNKTSSTFELQVYKNRISIGTPFRGIPAPVVAATEFSSANAKATLIPKAKKP